MQTQHAHFPWFAGDELLRTRRDAVSASKARQRDADAAVRAPGLSRGAAVVCAILGAGAVSVLAPAMSPPVPEAARIAEAQQIQQLATHWQLQNHPRDDALYFHPAFPPPTLRASHHDTEAPPFSST
ncbi:hypothetical protein [Sorangium cellulosum]|uniref:Uncharacterized protein n=1 Tax=Sorangium cellulosum So0157-2 TaxID=1254432 RepID=S4Y6W6_SORCE|nr:hypothetical protein [Sorangium cellulosum]AGP41187.1 hypothetical protein SCE1572_45895 [Sorangium cellulosum So0157-2]